MSTLEIPTGLCRCGCGTPTKLVRKSDGAKGLVRGEPRRFATGHSVRARWLNQGPPFAVEDCGYTTPCWVWQRARTGHGYGSIRSGTGSPCAHVRYWVEVNGLIPAGLELDHLCRVRACVNPAHLEPVTRAENVRRGTATKLTLGEVEVIRRSSESNRRLAARYGVSNVQIHKIKRGKSWRPS